MTKWLIGAATVYAVVRVLTSPRGIVVPVIAIEVED